MKRRTVLVTLVLFLVIGLPVGLLMLLAPTVHWDRWDNVRITGQIVDSASGQPHPDVSIMTLTRREDADNEKVTRFLRDWAQRGLDSLAQDAERGHDTSDACRRSIGLTTTNDQGQFSFCVRVHYGGTDWGLFFSSKPHAPPPFHGVGTLLLEWPGGRRVVIDTTDGKWTEIGDRDLHATLDMGTVTVPTR